MITMIERVALTDALFVDRALAAFGQHDALERPSFGWGIGRLNRLSMPRFTSSENSEFEREVDICLGLRFAVGHFVMNEAAPP